MNQARKIINQVVREKTAVIGFNVYKQWQVATILAAAKAKNQSVFLMTSERAIEQAGLANLYALLRQEISQAGVLAAIHLDHGHNLEICRQCLAIGYDSVMLDGSSLPYNENVALTKQVALAGRERATVIEAEIGRLGTDGLTNVDEARKFAAASGADLLAVALGSGHGILPGEKLNIARLREIAAAVTVPLVLHGASGVPIKDIRLAIAGGIRKINVGTDIRACRNAEELKGVVEKWLDLML